MTVKFSDLTDKGLVTEIRIKRLCFYPKAICAFLELLQKHGSSASFNKYRSLAHVPDYAEHEESKNS